MKSQSDKTIMSPRLSAFAVTTICVIAIALPIAVSGQAPQLGVSTSAKQPTIVTFDPPGSIATIPDAINPAGKTTGIYVDVSGVGHGFLRASDGSFTTFDVPGALGTRPWSINPAGVIAGFYGTPGTPFLVLHGFVRALDGTLTTFDAPDAGTSGGQGTAALNINPAGEIAGNYADASGVNHGFVRAPDGTTITFDAPGAGTGSGQGTFTASVDGLNPAGAINVQSQDSSGVNHGFVRAADGTLTPYDVPAAGTAAGQGTIPNCNNPSDAVTGYYIDASGVPHGFLRIP